MKSMERKKEKNSHLNPGTDSKSTSLAQFFRKKHEEKNPQAPASAGTPARSRAGSLLTWQEEPHHPSSQQKSKEKTSRSNRGNESKIASVARSLQKKVWLFKPSDSESRANAKQKRGEKNPQGVVCVDHHRPPPPTQVAPSPISSDQSSITIPIRLPSQGQPTYSVTSVPQINTENYGSNNQLHVGDDNRGTVGIIGHRSINFLVQQFYHSSQAGERSTSIKLGSIITAVIFIEATHQVLGILFGDVIANSAIEFEKDDSEGKFMEETFYHLIESIKSAMERDDRSIRQTLRVYLKDPRSDLWRERQQLSSASNNSLDNEMVSVSIAWKLRLFLFVNHMAGYIPPAILIEGVKKRMVKLLRTAEASAARQLTKGLPSAKAAYDDSRQRHVSCFEGTRQALLEEMGGWVANAETGIFVLFGLAGIGKSTIAQTVAERADNVRLLGASFFFSRDEAERRTAERFFTTIASQLRVRHPEFASAIESVLMTEQGKDAVTKFPLEQLEMLILEPLRELTPRKVVIVVDALDECDSEDIPIVLMGLNKLVQHLPSFKVILTTRPQQHLQLLRTRQESQKVFDLHDIEDKIVDDDIERYLRHKLSLEEVGACLPHLRVPWAATDDEIKLLVRAAGRLFIIASTAVLFILDKTSTPAYRMKLLLGALEKDHTPFKALNNFYTTILRSAVPAGSEDDTRDRYQSVIGAIILIQQPLTVSALAKLIDMEVNAITMVLGNLQPVILLGSNDIPLTYHKSFPDYIQDAARCKDEDLRIDPKPHHTRMAMHCLRLLNQCLKQNILNLGGPTRFMENHEALKEHGLTESDLQEKIPSELRYACLHFVNHLESANIEDSELAEELERFFNERFLNWLEALSWIGRLDSAHQTLLTVQKQLKTTSSDLRQLLADGLRFTSKFYQFIGRSALHIYHSALPLTPIETRLYERYKNQVTFCRVQGGLGRWDDLIATMESEFFKDVVHIVFSPDGANFACCIQDEEDKEEDDEDEDDDYEDDNDEYVDEDEGIGLITIHDAVAGIPSGKIEGQVFAIANDFSKAAVFDDGSITLYHLKGFTPITTIKPSATVIKLALSRDGSRLAAGLDDDTVCLWDTEKCEQIESFAQCGYEVALSPDGSRIALTSYDGVVKLLDGTTGKIIADLGFPRLEKSMLMFFGDGSQLACLSAGFLRAWNSRDGALIGKAKDAGDTMTISTDGSRLVTGKVYETSLKLFSGNNLALLETLDVEHSIQSIAIHDDWIGVASFVDNFIAIYDIISHTFIAKLPFGNSTFIAFSPDRTRLAAGNSEGDVRLWDIASIPASSTSFQGRSENRFRRLVFSPDCSRLVSGHDDGTIKLWDTTNMTEIAPSPHKCHSQRINALAFSANGEEFASGSRDGTIRLWDGKDGAPNGVLECGGPVRAVALSTNMLAASTEDFITLWDLRSRSDIATLFQPDTTLLTFSHHPNSLLAAAHCAQLTLWDTAKHECITTFQLSNRRRNVRRMTFLPNNSQIAVQDHQYDYEDDDEEDEDEDEDDNEEDDQDEDDNEGDNDHDDADGENDDEDEGEGEEDHSNDNFYLFNVYDSEASGSQVPENQDISRLSLCTSWHGIPVWNQDLDVLGRFPQRKEDVAVFSCPSDFHVRTIAEGSSMIALGCEDGRILLIKEAN